MKDVDIVSKGTLPLIIILSLLSFSISTPNKSIAQDFSSNRTSFSIGWQDLQLSHSIASIFVLPKEVITLECLSTSESQNYALEGSFGDIGQVTPFRWRCKAPENPGLYSIRVLSRQPVDSMLINVFVMVLYDSLSNGYLNGYRIGSYPKILFRQLNIYKPPRGFVEVTPDLMDVYVSPHFKLGQFVCKQEAEFPKYLVLRELLLLKLELILEKVNEAGYYCNTFSILSGFRTPYYNKTIGNVKYSRHQWGGAADIFIDEQPSDGIMDDLNRDGMINWKDAAILYDIIDEMSGKGFFQRLIGGLARYRKTDRHGPFVHVDVRGFKARWGD